MCNQSEGSQNGEGVEVVLNDPPTQAGEPNKVVASFPSQKTLGDN